MPTKSIKQRRFMRAAAHDPEFAKRNNIDPKVAKEFLEADKKRKKKKASTEAFVEKPIYFDL